MSMRLAVSHRGRTAALTLAATVVLVGAGSTAALAEPQPYDRDGCAISLARAASWPGSMQVGDNTVRLVSDAFTSYLARHGGCSADLSKR